MNFKRRIADLLDMPSDVLEDLPKITLYAQEKLILSGQHRLVACREDRIVFLTRIGRLVVEGESLTVEEIMGECTVLGGRIYTMSYQMREL